MPTGESTPAELVALAHASGVELWPEGPRLRFRGPASALLPALRDSLRERRADIVDWLRRESSRREEIGDLAENQRGLWFLHKLAPQSDAYHLAFAARLHGPVDVERLREALQVLVDRHDALRTTYPMVHGEARRRTLGHSIVALTVVDCRSWSKDRVRAEIESAHRRPFDLDTGPLFRVGLYRETDDVRVLLLSAHHIAVDGTAMHVLLEETFAVYSALLREQPLPAAGDTASFAEFVAWQAEYVSRAESDRAYWIDRLSPPGPPLGLPTTRPRAAHSMLRAATVWDSLNTEVVAALRNFARSEGVTDYVLLLTLWFVFLHRLTGRTDVTVGTPVLGRPTARFERTVGDLINMLPFRLRGFADLSFREALQHVRAVVLEGMAHQDFPLPRMVESSRRAAVGVQPFETLFVLQDFSRFATLETLMVGREDQRVVCGDLVLSRYGIDQLEAQFELGLEVWPRGDEFLCAWRYDCKSFEEITVRGWAHDFLTLASIAITTPTAPISSFGLGASGPPRLDVPGTSERDRVVLDF